MPSCVSQFDIENERINIRIPAKPENNSGSTADYWFKSGVELYNNEQISFLLKDFSTVNFCAFKDEEGNLKKYEQVVHVDKNKGNAGNDFYMYPGDQIFFELQPYKQILPTNKTCNNGYDENFYFGNQNQEQCFQMIKNKSYSSAMVGNYDGTYNANVWTRFSGAAWRKGKLLNFDADTTKLLQNCVVSKKTYYNDAYSLNYRCGDICNKNKNTDCFYTLANINDNDPYEGHYLQGLKGKIVDPDGNLLQEFKTVGDIDENGKGLQIGTPYVAEYPGRLNLYFFDYIDKLFAIDNRSNENIEIQFAYVHTLAGTNWFSGWGSRNTTDPVVKLNAKSLANYDFKKHKGAYTNMRKGEIQIKKNGKKICGFKMSHNLSSNLKKVQEKNKDGIPTKIIVNEDYTCEFQYDRNERKTSGGGYKVKISKFCNDRAKGSLFYYVGENPPPVMPGDFGTKKVNIPDNSAVPFKFNVSTTKKGHVYFGVQDNGDGYENNIGYYHVYATKKRDGGDVVSIFIRWFRDRIKQLLYGDSDNYKSSGGVVGMTVNSMTSSKKFFKIVQAILALYISIYGFMYMSGMVKSTQTELAVALVKIGIIVVMLQPNSWNYLRYYLFDFYLKGGVELINLVSGQYDGNAADFHFIDKFLYRFAIPETWIQMMSLFVAWPTGIMIFAMIIYALKQYLSAIFDAICMYIVSIVAVGLMLMVSPVFILFLLFKRTKAFFDAWLKSMAQATMQPVLVFFSYGNNIRD